MRVFHFTSEQVVPRALEQVFAVFASAQNLELLTPPWLHFAILTCDPIEMRQGTTIDYRLRLHGFPIRWQSEITVVTSTGLPHAVRARSLATVSTTPSTGEAWYSDYSSLAISNGSLLTGGKSSTRHWLQNQT